MEVSKKNCLVSSDKDKKIFEEIMKLRNDHLRAFGTLIKSKAYAHLYEWLNMKTPLLQNGKYTTITKLYWVAHGLTDFPVCRFCHKEKLIKNITNFEKGYFRACSTKCEGMKKEKQKKIEQTCLRNWGATNFFGSETGKTVREEWCKEHGVSNPFQLESVKQKSRESRKANFGYEYTMQSEEKRKLASDNYLEKTGYRHQFENPDIIEKSAKTKADKKAAGIDDYAKTRVTNRHTRYRTFVNCGEIMPLFLEQDFAKLNAETQYTTLLKWKCLKCGTELEAYIDQNFSSRLGLPVRCEKCHPFIFDGTSCAEREMVDFIQNDCGFSIIEGDRSVISPYELDIYVPSKNIAVEFDGLYWHSEKTGRGRNYHLMKTEMCEKTGIQLIHIFEDEWSDKKEIVKSNLKNMFGMYEKTVFAKNCDVIEPDPITAAAFQDENDIRGSINGSVRIGLALEGKLISLMTFGKCGFSKERKWEILGFCTKLGYHIPEAADKLLSSFENAVLPKTLVAYADRRWSKGELHLALGFNFIRNSPPEYFYAKGQARYSKMQFQKCKLKSVLENFDPNKTEIENLNANGYFRIFDCGNMMFEKTYPGNVK